MIMKTSIAYFFTDNYPFGMPMPNRTFSLSSGSKYRFGFNGKENDNEIYGEGNAVDFGARMYDGRIGRWMSADPKRKCYPGHSPYNYALNSPIFLFDPNGKWVAKIDVNSAGEYSLTFVAQEKDDLNSLSTQLGIPKETLLKQDPTLQKLEITNGLELKLDKIEQVKEINSGINYISKNQGTTNCANFAYRCDGGSNLKDDGGGVDDMECKVGNVTSLISQPDMKILSDEVEPYQPVSEEESRIGDVITYKISDCSKNENGVTPIIFNKERHFSVVVLKDAEGCAPSQIIQKNGTSDFKFKVDPAYPVKLPNTKNVEYTPVCPKGGSTSPINRN